MLDEYRPIYVVVSVTGMRETPNHQKAMKNLLALNFGAAMLKFMSKAEKGEPTGLEETEDGVSLPDDTSVSKDLELLCADRGFVTYRPSDIPNNYEYLLKHLGSEKVKKCGRDDCNKALSAETEFPNCRYHAEYKTSVVMIA